MAKTGPEPEREGAPLARSEPFGAEGAPLRHYAAFGLRFASPFPLPLQQLACTDAAPDVVVRLGELQSGPFIQGGRKRPWRITPTEFWLAVKGIARYHVAEGRRLVVQPIGGGVVDVGAFFVSSVCAAVLMQRGIVALHASAVATDAGAVLFMGGSGIGKSSLLTALLQRGHAMLADDVTGVVVRDGGAVALPAFPNLRLWTNMLDDLGWRTRAGDRVRAGVDKYWVSAPRFQTEPVAIRCCFALGIGERVAATRLAPQAALASLGRNTYRKRFLAGSGMEATHFRAMTHIAHRLPVLELTRPAAGNHAHALADQVEACLAEDQRCRGDSAAK